MSKRDLDWVVRQTMNGTDAPTAMQDAFGLLKTLEKLPKGRQVLAIVTACHLICQHQGLKPQDAFAMSGRRIKDALSQGRGEHVRAIQAYIQGEIG